MDDVFSPVRSLLIAAGSSLLETTWTLCSTPKESSAGKQDSAIMSEIKCLCTLYGSFVDTI